MDAVAIGERVERVQFDYPKLRERLAQWRADVLRWEPPQHSVAVVSADEKSDGQRRFVEMLGRSGFQADVSFYRDNFVSLPAGRQPAEVFDKEKPHRPLVSLASRICYSIGLLARHADAQVIVVSHAFELYWPMSDFAERAARSKGKGGIGLAFFGSLLDTRWKHTGIFEGTSPIKFYDLDEFAPELLGGIDLGGRVSNRNANGSASTSKLSSLI
jgi:hypothetical protein